MWNPRKLVVQPIIVSLALAIVFPIGGCEADPSPQDAFSPSSKLSSVAKKVKTAKKSPRELTYETRKEAIFVLGGAAERERFAAVFAKSHPGLPIWVSSGSSSEYAQRVFARAGIKKSRVHLDYQAVDTVTNFTSLVDQFKAEGIDSIYLITSDYHMRRARIVGAIVFGSRGIKLLPVPVSLGRAPEPTEKCLRDAARAMLWVSASNTSATSGQRVNIASLLSACAR